MEDTHNHIVQQWESIHDPVLLQRCQIAAPSTQSMAPCSQAQAGRSRNVWCATQVEDITQLTVTREGPKKGSCRSLTILIVPKAASFRAFLCAGRFLRSLCSRKSWCGQDGQWQSPHSGFWPCPLGHCCGRRRSRCCSSPCLLLSRHSSTLDVSPRSLPLPQASSKMPSDAGQCCLVWHCPQTLCG